MPPAERQPGFTLPAERQVGFTLPAERQLGFTLIEMIVVLAVLALAAGLVLTRGPQRSATLELRRATATVAGAMGLARSRAIARNGPVPVFLDPRAPRLQVGTDAPRLLPSGVGMAVMVPAGRESSVVFLPDGSATGGQVVLSLQGRAARVGVEWLTGRVSIADVSPR